MSDESDCPVDWNDRARLAEQHILTASGFFRDSGTFDTIAIAVHLNAALSMLGYPTAGIGR